MSKLKKGLEITSLNVDTRGKASP